MKIRSYQAYMCKIANNIFTDALFENSDPWRSEMLGDIE